MMTSLYFPVGDGEFQLRTCIMKTYGPRGLTHEEECLTTDCQEHGEWLKMRLG